MPPDVGKYKPKYSFVWADDKEIKVRKEHSKLGSARKELKEE